MSTSTKKLILLLCAMLSVSLIASSQTAVLSDKGDTSICFTVQQAKYLLKQCYKVKECYELDSLCEEESGYKDSVIVSDDMIITATKLLVLDKEAVIAVQKQEIAALNKDLEKQKDATKTQKNRKRIWMGATGLVSLFFGYYIITH